MENTQLKTIIKTLEKIVTKVDRLEDGQGRLATKVDRLENGQGKLVAKVDLLESGQDRIFEQIDAKTTEIMQAMNSDK